MLLEVCVHILESLYTDIGVIYSIRFCDCPMILEVVPLTNRAVIGDSDYKIRTEKTNRKRNTKHRNCGDFRWEAPGRRKRAGSVVPLCGITAILRVQFIVCPSVLGVKLHFWVFYSRNTGLCPVLLEVKRCRNDSVLHYVLYYWR